MTEIKVRPARPDDAEIGARLLFISGSELFSYAFNRPQEAIERMLAKMWGRQGHLFSYQWANLAETEAGVVGILTGFTSSELRQASSKMYVAFARTMWPWDLARMAGRSADLSGLSPDVESGDYYIGNVAVLHEARSQGIGHALMAFAAEQAIKKGCQRCVLDVIIENERAQSLYRDCGYVVLETHTSSNLKQRCGISGMYRMVHAL